MELKSKPFCQLCNLFHTEQEPCEGSCEFCCTCESPCLNHIHTPQDSCRVHYDKGLCECGNLMCVSCNNKKTKQMKGKTFKRNMLSLDGTSTVLLYEFLKCKFPDLTKEELFLEDVIYINKGDLIGSLAVYGNLIFMNKDCSDIPGCVNTFCQFHCVDEEGNWYSGNMNYPLSLEKIDFGQSFTFNEHFVTYYKDYEDFVYTHVN